MTPCAAPPWPGWVAMGAAERTDESSLTISPRPFRRCPAWATLPAWDWVLLACDRHVAMPGDEVQAGWGRRRAQRLTKKTKQTKKTKTSDTMAVQFDPSICLAVDVHVQNKTYVYCQSALYELGTDSHRSFFFFFKWRARWDAIKQLSMACVFTPETNPTLQFDSCAVPFQWSCCPCVQCLHHHCWPWSA